ncbi:MAG TPA: hypothetical protein VN519_16305 [Bryobacteraceae bacterium]|nr:hypothetical protein [Bryobacteraceae bacterium]
MTKTLIALVCLASCSWAQEGTGPFPAIVEQDPGLPTHTIYRPKDLNALKDQKLPIVAWGNGGCANNSAFYKPFLSEIASNGYLAIATGTPQAPPPPANAGGRGAGGGGRGGQATKSSQLLDAITWAIAENGRRESPYYNKLDTSEVAVMGHSCGGIQALAVGNDPRVKLIINWSGGLFTTPPAGAGAGMENVPKEQLDKLHTPVFYISGDSTDIAFANSNDDFKRITKVPAFRAWKDGIGHGGTYNQPGGGDFGKVALPLLQWQLRGDQEAGKMFLGANCGLCQDSKWHVEKKGIN